MPAHNTVPRAQFDRSTQHRRALYAKINIGRQQLNIDQDDYRQIVMDETGRLSLKEASEAQLEKVLDRLKALGFQPLPKPGAPRGAQHPMARKARALWISLHQLGAVHNPSEQALEAFAKRQLKCERLSWANQRQAYKLIEGLKAMAVREGWLQTDRTTGKQLTPRALQNHLCEVILGKLKKAGAVPADWSIDVAAKRLCGIDTTGDAPFSAEAYARLAQSLGRKLRELAPQECAA